MRSFAYLLWPMMLATVLAGCGTRKPVITGVVKLDGRPLDNGNIQFIPEAGDGQTAAAVLDKDGRYRVELSPTKMKVVISSSRVVGKRKAYEGVADSPEIEIREEVLPARYSDRSKTELGLIADKDKSVDFDLKSGR